MCVALVEVVPMLSAYAQTQLASSRRHSLTTAHATASKQRSSLSGDEYCSLTSFALVFGPIQFPFFARAMRWTYNTWYVSRMVNCTEMIPWAHKCEQTMWSTCIDMCVS